MINGEAAPAKDVSVSISVSKLRRKVLEVRSRNEVLPVKAKMSRY